MLEAGAVIASASDCVKIWDARTDHLHLNSHYTTENLSGGSSFKDVSWNVNNSKLACIANGSGIVLYNFQEGVKNEGKELSKSKEQTAVCYGSGKNELFSGGVTGDINQWNCSTNELTNTFTSTHSSAVRRLAKMGDKIVSASATGELFIWQTDTASVLTKLKTPKPKSIRGLEHSRYDRAMLSTTSDDGVVCLWDIEKQAIRHKFTSHNAPAMDLSFSTINALLLASGGLDKKIIFYDAQSKNIVQTFTSVQPVTAVCFLGNGMHVCAGTSMGNILLYDLRNNSAPLSSLHGHSTSVQRLVLQTLKERKKSSRTSSSKSSEKKLSRPREDAASRSLTHQPNEQQSITRVSRSSSSKKPAAKVPEAEPSLESSKGNTENLITPLKTPQNDKAPSLFTSVNRSIASPHHDTMGSYCEGIFSPIANVNGSIQEDSFLNQDRTKSINAYRSSSTRLNSSNPALISATPDSKPTNGGLEKESDSNVDAAHGRLTNGAGLDEARDLPKNTKNVYSSTPVNPLTNLNPSLSNDTDSAGTSHRLSIPTEDAPFSTPRNSKQGSATITPNTTHTSNPFQYQLDFLQNSVRDLVEEHEDNIREELKHLHLQMIKMFAEQNEVIRHLAEQCSVNPLLLQEIERLRNENDRLRRKF